MPRRRSSAACAPSPKLHLILFSLPVLLAAAPPPGFAQDAASAATPLRSPCTAHVAEASRRFGVPEPWIVSVMRVESAGQVRAVSRAGAMGCMQIMPATWAELRARYGFGTDPFDPRENVLAGTAYLRRMHDLYGMPGALAAYNAGPGRYDAYLAGRRNLPAETVAYVARLGPLTGGGSAAAVAADTRPDLLAWTRAPLFVALSSMQPTDTETALSAPSVLPETLPSAAETDVADAIGRQRSSAGAAPDHRAPERSTDSLFAVRRPQ
ncbi:MAG: lytic transglycosylase domain-containing protein [Allosphingosinicella sp.]|uniref:lytic transglycosylase domain-containing protein n=1 Tax=Allosphingosinicella sp. TaxID=2823234 RepID=UPI0039389674